MREILYRGKRVDNDEWVEGFLYITQKGNYEINRYSKELDIERLLNFVIPKTVGLFTGLTDKNGTKIFEGDIVRIFLENENCEYDYEYFDVGRVFWYQQQTRFLRTSKLFPDDCPSIAAWQEYEVIGNIYDNPELLEAEE